MKTRFGWKKILIWAGGAFVFIIIAVMMMQSEVLVNRLMETSQKGDMGERDKLWAVIIPLFLEHPIWGVGETGYNYYAIINFGGEAESPHNVILEVLCYVGLVGLTIYFVFLYQLFVRGYQVYKNNGLLLPLILIIPILGMLLTGQILYDKMGWVIFAYMVGSSAVQFRQQKIIQI